MACPTLDELPPPPSGKTGWPWTEQSDPLPDTQPDGAPWPKISIVTPSYNQGQFIEETLRSILLQGYPNLEYIVMDGGSTDGSAAIIQKYEPWLTYWTSAPDDGQSDAINRGFERATGRIYNWVNSDDFLRPRALHTVGTLFALPENIQWLTGARIARSDQTGTEEVHVPWRSQWPQYLLDRPDFPQEATFFSADAWDAVGGLDEELQNVMDVLFYHQMLRYTKRGAFTSAPLSGMNVHMEQKTKANDDRLRREMRRVKQDYFTHHPFQRLVQRALQTRWHKQVWNLWRTVSAQTAARTFLIARHDYERSEWSLAPFYAR